MIVFILITVFGYYTHNMYYFNVFISILLCLVLFNCLSNNNITSNNSNKLYCSYFYSIILYYNIII